MEELPEDMERIDLLDSGGMEKDYMGRIEGALFEGGRNLIAHQINSFEQFMGHGIEELIQQEFAEVEVLPSYGASAASHKHKQQNSSSAEESTRPGWRRAKLSFQSVEVAKPEWTSEDG
eukprot:c38333_g1_i1 orf=3-356(-)